MSKSYFGDIFPTNYTHQKQEEEQINEQTQHVFSIWWTEDIDSFCKINWIPLKNKFDK